MDDIKSNISGYGRRSTFESRLVAGSYLLDFAMAQPTTKGIVDREEEELDWKVRNRGFNDFA